jgi:hypothetical protein
MKRNKVFQIKKIFKANKKFKNKISNIPIKILKIQIHLKQNQEIQWLNFQIHHANFLTIMFQKNMKSK